MSWISRIANALRPHRVDQTLDEELRHHLEARIESLTGQGYSRAEAERAAYRKFGPTLHLREESHDVKLSTALESIFQDVRFGFRMLRKDSTVSLAAVLSLSLAIGACAAAFSLIDALILRPIPVRDPSGLFYATHIFKNDDGQEREGDSMNYPLFRLLRDAAKGEARIFAAGYASPSRVVFERSNGEEEKINTQWMSGDAFEVLGIRPALGRLLNASDDGTPGGHPVAVISHGLWTRRFGRDPAVIGTWVRHADHQLQIVGVAQDGFHGIEPGRLTDLWAPIMMGDKRAFETSGWHWFRIFGRFEPGKPAGPLEQKLAAVAANHRRERLKTFPSDTPKAQIDQFLDQPFKLRPAANGASGLRRDFERPLWILSGVAALVLLIACSNVANLFLARAAAREREMALRVSIGAGTLRLIRQVLIECGLLASAACLAGIAFAAAASPTIVGMLTTPDNPVYLDLAVDTRVIAFASALSALVTLLFGLAPAVRASRTSPNDALKAGAGRHSRGAGMLRPLVAVQVGLCFTVLFTAGLLLLSFHRVASIHPGFDRDNLVLYSVEGKDLPDKSEQSRTALLQVVDRVRAIPGVESASASSWGLFRGWGWKDNIRIPGRAVDTLAVNFLEVSPGFFGTMKIGLFQGRDFEPRDSAPEKPTAVIVNEALVQRYYPDRSPLGQTFHTFEENNRLQPREIVGVVANSKYNGLKAADHPGAFVPMRGIRNGTLEIRTAADPLAMAGLLRAEIQRVHPSLKVTDISLQSALIDSTLIRERLLALLSGFFAIVGLAIAAVGLYGVLSYAVVQRTKEIGIRIALGARSFGVVRLVVGDVTLFVAIGLVVGLAGGLALARTLTTFLYEVKPSDFWSVALPLGGLLLAAILAAVPPAVRASRTDPMIALRYE